MPTVLNSSRHRQLTFPVPLYPPLYNLSQYPSQRFPTPCLGNSIEYYHAGKRSDPANLFTDEDIQVLNDCFGGCIVCRGDKCEGNMTWNISGIWIGAYLFESLACPLRSILPRRGKMRLPLRCSLIVSVV
jgi:hypothetical protein